MVTGENSKQKQIHKFSIDLLFAIETFRHFVNKLSFILIATYYIIQLISSYASSNLLQFIM
jgi:hypothetical protein